MFVTAGFCSFISSRDNASPEPMSVQLGKCLIDSNCFGGQVLLGAKPPMADARAFVLRPHYRVSSQKKSGTSTRSPSAFALS